MSNHDDKSGNHQSSEPSAPEQGLTPLITQCLNCTTRFKVSAQQLKIAQGRVRCGACLSVFDATTSLCLDGEPVQAPEEDVDALLEEISDHWTQDKPSPKRTPQPQRDTPEESFSNEVGEVQASLEHSPGEQPDDNMQHEHAPADNLAEPKASAPAAQFSQAALDELDILEAQLLSDIKINADGETSAEEPTPQGGNDLLRAEIEATVETEEIAQLDQPEQTDEFSGFVDSDAPVHATAVESELPKNGQPNENLQNDNLADQSVGEDAAEPEDVEQEAERDGDELTMVESLQPVLVAVEQTSEEVELSESGIEVSIESKPHDAEESEKQSPSVSSTRLPEFGIQFDDFDEPATKRPLVTYALIILALLVLPAQVLWFQYDLWIKDAQVRPIYQTLCDVWGCTLPPMKDVGQIVSRKSVSRPHPEDRDIRIVDVLMVNNASFAQPYPLIELTFTNVRGLLVAGRRYKPSEYLHGELANTNLMQPRTPIHISLQLADPGDNAQGFRVVFR